MGRIHSTYTLDVGAIMAVCREKKVESMGGLMQIHLALHPNTDTCCRNQMEMAEHIGVYYAWVFGIVKIQRTSGTMKIGVGKMKVACTNINHYDSGHKEYKGCCGINKYNSTTPPTIPSASSQLLWFLGFTSEPWMSDNSCHNHMFLLQALMARGGSGQRGKHCG